MKKLFIMALGLLLLCSLAFAGGRGGQAGTSGSPAQSKSAAVGFKATGLPIVTTPVTIDVLQARWRAHGADYMTNAWYTNLAKETNVNITWRTEYAGDDWNQEKALMFASGDVPSVIFGSIGFLDSDYINNIEYFIPLDDLIDKYMPNLKAVFQQDPDLKKIVTFTDGHIYSLPARLPARPQVSYQPYINQTWLDKLGLKVPQTTEELYQVLKAFKERDPNGNGIADEIVYTATAPTTTLGYNDIFSLFGINNAWSIVGGKVVYSHIRDEYRQAVEFYGRLYAEGILDREFFTQTEEQWYAKIQNANPSLIGYITAWTPDALLQANAKGFVTIAPPASPSGRRYSTIMDQNIRRNELAITTKCQYPEVVARWADQFYTPDATVQNYWGSFGECTQKEPDGSYSLLPLQPSFDSLDFRAWNRSPRDSGPGFMPVSFTKYNLPKDNGDGLKLEIAKIGDPYVYINEIFPRYAYATPEQQREIASLQVDITNYVISTFAEWVSAGRVTDAQWNAYKAQLQRMGLDRYTAIQTDIYNTYNK
jgi:putative aldouronate transport system substrate-binding protein